MMLPNNFSGELMMLSNNVIIKNKVNRAGKK